MDNDIKSFLGRASSSHTLVIGDVMLDEFHWCDVTRISPEAPVPVFNAIKLIKNGGMAMNVYANLQSLGANPNICTNNNWKSITKTRFVDRRTNHMFMRLDENDDKYGICNIQEINFKLYDAVVVSDYNKGFLSKEDLRHISVHSRISFLDTKKIIGDWASEFTFIKINHYEYENTKQYLTSKTMKNLIVTKGPNGCIYQNKVYDVPLVEVKDTSGAGDTFVAALCYKFCETNNIDLSIKFANDCSTKVVQKMGVASI